LIERMKHSTTPAGDEAAEVAALVYGVLSVTIVPWCV
jgi:hypothetical protein